MNHHEDPTPEPITPVDWRAVMAEHDARPDGWAHVPASPLTSAPTAGETHAVGTVAPDVHEGVRHALRANGTVARFGTVYTHATDPRLMWDPDAPCAHEVSAVREVMSELVEREYQARHGARGGTHAIDLTRIADLILAGTGTPHLLGTDVRAWEQVVSVPRDATVQDVRAALAVAHLNYTDPWDAAREWFGIARPNTPGAVACAHRMIVRPTVTRGTARRSVVMGRKRAGDVLDVERTCSTSSPAPAACEVFGVLALVAPHTVGREPTVRERVDVRDDDGKLIGRTTRRVRRGRTVPPTHRWQGHALVERPSTHAPRRAARRAATRLARTLTLTVDALTATADGMAPGTRVRFTCGNVSGTVARSDRGAWSVRATRDGGKTVARSSLRQARYVRNVVANLAR